MVGLAGFEGYYPHALSGGMQQRVGLARALVVDPDTLLMDEPFGALDAQTRHQLQDELLQLWQGHRKTVVLVTHDMEEAVYLSDRVLVLSSRPGRIAREIAIPLPRPRDVTVRRTAAFAELVEHVWESLKDHAGR
jgi:NitT/TauT family transport system ATP-binding protein